MAVMMDDPGWRRAADEAVLKLDAIDPTGDPEGAHSEADKIVLDALPEDVRNAYQRVIDRAPWWAAG